MASLSEFAGSVLLHQSGSYEPQRKSNFALIINGLTGAGDDLILMVKDVDLPPTAINQKSIKYFNETMHYAGAVTPFTDMTVNYHDYIDRAGLTTLAAWMQSVWNPATGAIGWAKDYKKTGQLLMLPPGISGAAPGEVDTSSVVGNRIWELSGIWIRQFKPDQFDHENDGDNTLINVVISIDRAFPADMGVAS